MTDDYTMVALFLWAVVGGAGGVVGWVFCVAIMERDEE